MAFFSSEKLSKLERGKVKEPRSLNQAYNNIGRRLAASKVKHSKTIILNFVQNLTTYASPKSIRRPRIFSKGYNI